MLFIPTSFLRSLIRLSLGSSWASCLLHRIHVAVSCLFLGFSGSCHRLIPRGLCVRGVPSSMVWCSKLSVHIFVCWEVTTEASCSALVVTDRLLLTSHTIFFLLYWSSCHKTEEIFIWSPHRSQRELGFSTNRTNAAQLLLYSMTIVPTVGLFPLLCTPTSPIGVFGFCFGVYCPHALQAQAHAAHMLISRALVWNPERWIVCERRNALSFSEP